MTCTGNTGVGLLMTISNLMTCTGNTRIGL
jgi:hypothetical protein